MRPRRTAGRLLTYHGGDLAGFHSQISFMPKEKLGVIVFVIGDHCPSSIISSATTYTNVCLGIDETPWSDRISSSG